MSHEKFQQCIDLCNECAVECNHCITACLREPDVKQMSRCIELDLYCADICQLAASFMARGEEYVHEVCALCADICMQCGEECAKFDAEHCKKCASACLRCAEECSKMASMDVEAMHH